MAVYFLSDAHLGARYISDPRSHELQICRWLDRVRPGAEALYLLGDMLDYWFEYRDVVPRGYVRFFAALARWTDAGIPVIWLHGNHDMWTRDYLSSELGIDVRDGIVDVTIHGLRVVMEHGDGVGRQPMSFRLLRKVFRSCIARRMFAALHPWLTMSLALSWSGHNRTGRSVNQVVAMRDRAIASLCDFCAEFTRRNGHVDCFVFGHLHHAVSMDLPDLDSSFTVLPDCYQTMGYGRLSDGYIELLSMTNDRPLGE